MFGSRDQDRNLGKWHSFTPLIIAILQLEGRTLSTAYTQLFHNCISAIEMFFSSPRLPSLWLFKEMLLCNCSSAYSTTAIFSAVCRFLKKCCSLPNSTVDPDLYLLGSKIICLSGARSKNNIESGSSSGFKLMNPVHSLQLTLHYRLMIPLLNCLFFINPLC